MEPEAGTLAALAGLGGGLLLGLAARLGSFCTLGAIEDALYGRDLARLMSWTAALAVAAGLTALASLAGLARPEDGLWLATRWNPLGSVLGGLAFGYGMALAGACGLTALARAGTGDMRATVIAVLIGVSGYATLSGPLAWARDALFPIRPLGPEETPPGLGPWLEIATGWPPEVAGLAVAAALGAAALASPALRAAPGKAAWGAAVGVAVASGWVATTLIADAAFEPVAVVSHSFTRPIGDALFWLMTASAGGLGFAVGSVAGVVAGGFLGALRLRSFRWEACDDAAELRRQAAGAVLMGVGGVVALGCSVGQGLTAFSALAFSGPVTLAAIFAGAAFGLRQLIEGFSAAE